MSEPLVPGDVETPRQTPQIPTRLSEEGVFADYANQLNLTWSLFDVTIRFAQLVPVGPETTPPTWQIEERAAITMPWGQAKNLRDMLNDIVARYETKNGELKSITDLKLA